MFESITMNFLTQPKVVAAVDIFRALQTAATSLKNNLMILLLLRPLLPLLLGVFSSYLDEEELKMVRCT